MADKTTKINIVWIISIIIISLVILGLLGYSIYLLVADPTVETFERDAVRMDGLNLSSANLSNSKTVVSADDCEKLFMDNLDTAKAAVYESSTGFCGLKGVYSGLSVVDEDDFTLITPKANARISTWTANPSRDVDASSTIICSRFIGSQTKASALCTADANCQAYTIYTDPNDGTIRGCLKSSNVLINDSNTTKTVYTGSRV